MTADPLLMLNWLLRGGAIVLPLLTAALLWREHRTRVAGRLGAAFGVGAAAFALSTAPGFADSVAAWQAPITGLATANTLVFWLFTRALLDDGFRLRAWHALAWGVMALLGALNCLLARPMGQDVAQAIGGSLSLATVALAVLAVMQALVHWREDLVEERRRVRLFIAVGVGGHIVLMQAMATALGGDVRAAFASLLNAGLLLALNVFIAWRLLHLPGQRLFAAFEAPAVAPLPVAAAGPPPEPVAATEAPPDAGDTPPDPALVAALNVLMQVELVYREENLTIGTLAQRMGLAEHKLRRVINQGLGHRNFNAFLNTYRVEDARRALADSAFDAVPILTLAMDAGFSSLGPFNRAFKAATGLTPSDYRRQSRVDAAPPPAPDPSAGAPKPAPSMIG